MSLDRYFGRGSVCGCGGLRTIDRFVVFGDRLAAHGSLGRGPAGVVGPGPREHVRGVGDAAVRQYARGFDDPLIAVARPKRLAVAAVGIKDPRLDLLGQGVPADSLRDTFMTGLPWTWITKSRSKKFLSSDQRQVCVDDRFGALIEPVADKPLQLLEPFVMGERWPGALRGHWNTASAHPA